MTWFFKNFWKIIFLSFVLVMGYFIVSILMPIFSFFSFIGETFHEIQNIFDQLKQNIENYDWDKEKENHKDERA